MTIEIIRREKYSFEHLFTDKNDNFVFSDKLIGKLLGFIEAETYVYTPAYVKIISYGQEYSHFHLIKYGHVRLFDKNFDNMLTLQ